MTTVPKPKKKRRPEAQSEWRARDALTRRNQSEARKELARRFAVEEEKRIMFGKEALEMNSERQRLAASNHRYSFVTNALRPRLSAVISSFGVRAPLVLTPSQSPGASTDYRNIFVNYKPIDVDEDSAVFRNAAANIRGMTYHELGHILYTTPFPEVIALAFNTGWRNDRFRIKGHGRYDEQLVLNTFHHAWNALEDQRMEMQMVIESPRMASYFTVMVMEMILPADPDKRNMLVANYPLVVGRMYLSPKLRSVSRDAYMGEPSHTADHVDLLHRTVRKYLNAKSAKTMMEAVVAFAELTGTRADPDGSLYSDPFIIDKENGHRNEPEAKVDPVYRPGSDSEERILKEAVAKIKANKITTEADALKDDSDDSDDVESDGKPGHGAGPAGETDDVQAVLDQEWAEAVNQRNDDYNLAEDVKELNTAANTMPEDGLDLSRTGVAMSPEDEAFADQLAADIEQAFRVATADQAPTWQSQQRIGILEPIRYRTRAAGDNEFWRSYADHGAESRDVEVSIVLDISGSMASYQVALGQVAYACKAGCYQLGIPCEVLLFHSAGERMYGLNEPPMPPTVIQTKGSTNPTTIFKSCFSYQRDTKLHLILLMTDGEFDQSLEGTDMRLYNDHNRYSVFFKFDARENDSFALTVAGSRDRKDKLKSLVKHNPDEAYLIGSLTMIPHTLENLLATLVARS